MLRNKVRLNMVLTCLVSTFMLTPIASHAEQSFYYCKNEKDLVCRVQEKGFNCPKPFPTYVKAGDADDVCQNTPQDHSCPPRCCPDGSSKCVK